MIVLPLTVQIAVLVWTVIAVLRLAMDLATDRAAARRQDRIFEYLQTVRADHDTTDLTHDVAVERFARSSSYGKKKPE